MPDQDIARARTVAIEVAQWRGRSRLWGFPLRQMGSELISQQDPFGLIFGDPTPWHTMDWVNGLGQMKKPYIRSQLLPCHRHPVCQARVNHHAQSHRH
jgi:hypothetical protein